MSPERVFQSLTDTVLQLFIRLSMGITMEEFENGWKELKGLQVRAGSRKLFKNKQIGPKR